jgi:hypothetical protein
MATVLNQDVAGLHPRINRFLVEIHKSASSNISEMSAYDQNRVKTYLDAIDSYHAWVIGQPELDLPETSPRERGLEPDPELANVENENCNDLIRMMTTLRDEMTNGQSARRPSGLVSFDSTRLTACVAKCRSFMDAYVATVTPLDMPESSPMEAVSGKGKTGI